MRFGRSFTLWLSLATPGVLAGQTSDTGGAPQTPGGAVETAPAYERPVCIRQLPENFLSDQKRIWTFPAKLAKGHDWLPAAAILGTTAGLLALDPIEGAYFHRSTAFSDFNHIFTSNATLYGAIATPVSMFVIGRARHDGKLEKTALLAGEAIADSAVVSTAFKDITRRVRPENVPLHGNYYDTWFESGGSPISGTGGFPSGHTIVAFSAATVIAHQYRNHRWVPYAAYGLAALVGFSRLSLSAHFFSDVFAGAAFGYSISRFAVLRQ